MSDTSVDRGGQRLAVPAGGQPDRGVLRAELLLVLGLSLGQNAVYSLVDLLSRPVKGATAALFANVALVYQLLDIAFSLVPVALVLHFLARSAEGPGDIGLDARNPLGDLGRGAALAAVVGAVGLVLYAAAVRAGANRNVVPIPPTGQWWTVPVLLLAAARSGLLEEAIVCGYLLRRLDQMGWSKGWALAASAALRGGYHLYQGWGGFIGNFALGLFFGRSYQRRGRTTPLVVAHFLLDAGAGLGYLALRGRVSWLPR